MKNPWVLIRCVYRWLMSWYLKRVTCRITLSFSFSLSLSPSFSLFLPVFGCPPGQSATGSAGVPILLCLSKMSAKNIHTQTHTHKASRQHIPNVYFHQVEGAIQDGQPLFDSGRFIIGCMAQMNYFNCVCMHMIAVQGLMASGWCKKLYLLSSLKITSPF